MMWFRRVGLCAISACLLFAACSDTRPPPEPISFQRANRVAFVCVDLRKQIGTDGSLVPMSSCNPDPAGEETGFGLHALVLQSSRGEVAAVDLRAWRVLDSRLDIPGKTFAPAGPVPMAIATAPDHPRVVYVASSGSREISVLRTAATMVLSTVEPATLQRVPLKLPEAATLDEPYDMTMAPDQDALFVTSRAAGWLARIPIQRIDCEEGAEDCADGLLDPAGMVRIPLEASWAKLPAEAFDPNAGTSDEPYRFTCESTPPLMSTPSAPLTLPAQDADVGAPEPAGMAVDAFCEAGSCTRRLLIADARQPIVHAVDLDRLTTEAPADAILTPILTGAPTERVTVTPRVPVDLTSDAETQFVYAIDANDGSVIVTRDGRPLNVGADPTARVDRLSLGPTVSTASIVAISLAVLTPHFDVRGPASQWVRAVEEPRADDAPLECVDNLRQVRRSERLRGVFLAVGATDGTLRIFNVHDMELRECRSCTVGEEPSFSPFKPGYDPLPVVRNQSRLLTYATNDPNATPVLAPSVVPQFSVQGAAIGVKSDGTTNDTRVAGLDCITCGENQAVSFPLDETVDDTGGNTTTDAGVPGENTTCSEGQGRICSMADPFVEPRNWQAVYEGLIPATQGGRGRFVPRSSPDNQTGALEFAGDVQFCGAGVLGDDQLAPGDQLVITSPLPSDALRDELGQELSQAERELCTTLVDARTVNDNLIAFGIRRAFADRVQVTPELAPPRAARATWEQVLKCFANQPLTFEVHTRESFVVRDLGTLGFRHRVITQADSGRCVIDETQDPKLSSRAPRGQLYDNGLIAFQPRAGNFAPLTVLTLAAASNAPKLLVRAADVTGNSGWQGVMPIDIRYSPIDQRLYAVDSTVRGLMRISLNPVSGGVNAGDTIQ